MNKYQIEKAGAKYSGLTEDSKDPNSRIKGMLSIAFKDGVYWYINSVWHDPGTIPTKAISILAIKEDGSVLDVHSHAIPRWIIFVDIHKIVKWAYVIELMSNIED